MADLIPAWIFVAALPKEGLGQLRTWHSEAVEEDKPTMPQVLRDAMFQELKGARTQHLKEELEVKERIRKEKEAQEEELRAAQKVIAEARAVNDELRHELRKWRKRAAGKDAGKGKKVRK